MKALVKSYGVCSDLTKYDSLSTLKALCVNYFVNQMIENLQMKAISLMNFTAATMKQFTSVNLNGLQSGVQMNTKDLSRTVKRMKL